MDALPFSKREFFRLKQLGVAVARLCGLGSTRRNRHAGEAGGVETHSGNGANNHIAVQSSSGDRARLPPAVTSAGQKAVAQGGGNERHRRDI